LYELIAETTDAVGHSAECVKKVIIKKKNQAGDLDLIALAESKPARFVLDSLALVWDASLAPISL
jgi:hypothetical protein